jgi:AraC-like DNA-binding protein
MEKAKELILEKNYNIAETSYSVGYKHAQHFTVAFKKMYGYLPSELNTFQ